MSFIFISSMAYSSRTNTVLIDKLNKAIFDECQQNGFTFADNGTVSENNICIHGIHLKESGKRILANNLISKINNFFRIFDPTEVVSKKVSFIFPES